LNLRNVHGNKEKWKYKKIAYNNNNEIK
jgi:hypothetical protein